MKIGIYTNDLDGLIFLKEVAKDLGDYDYELHIDSRYLSVETEEFKNNEAKSLEEGVKALVEKGANLIFNLTQITNQTSKNVVVVNITKSTELKNYLENNPEVEKNLSRNQSRNIFLTEHTSETDKIIEALLGGVMIRE